MEEQPQVVDLAMPRVKATLVLGSETYAVDASKGGLSEQLVSLKEQSMGILKEFITKHNVPNDVPDEPLEGLSSDDEDDTESPAKPPVKKRK